LVGYPYPAYDHNDDVLLKAYLKNLPHAKKKVNIKAILLLPNEEGLVDETFVTDMRSLLAQAQAALGKVQPHGKKIFHTIMIQKMRDACKSKGMAYLLDSNEIINNEHVQNHIKSCAKIIRSIIKDNWNNYHHMFGKMEQLPDTGEQWRILFQNKKTTKKVGQDEATPTFTYHCDYHRNSIYSIFLTTKDIHKKFRYNLGVPANFFELVQVLLWSRLSNECET
jgi:hypothetical protein